MKPVLVLYYSQAGQTKRAVDEFCHGFDGIVEYDTRQIEPQEIFAFPWSMSEFFRAFPRCVNEIAPEIKPLSIDWQRYDLVVLASQVWFLSPSLPIQGFLQSPDAAGLEGKTVLSLVTCRNLWRSAGLKLTTKLRALGAMPAGQLTICELSPAWATFVTTPRWMLTGRKEGFWFFPSAGISESEFRKIAARGTKLATSWRESGGRSLAGVNVELASNLDNPTLAAMDRIGDRFFTLWGAIFRKIAPKTGFRQDILLVVFRVSLIVLIIGVGPCTKFFGQARNTSR